MIAKIKKYVNILDIADRFDIDLEDVCVGNFTHKCRCPHKTHKNGRERTGSCYVDSNKNNFYCFGCQAGSSSIDFYMACTGLEFQEALECLRPFVADIKDEKLKTNTKNNFNILLDISDMFYKKIQSSPFFISEIKSVMRKTDEYIFKISPSDIGGAQVLRAKIKKKLEEI